ncbi:MAG: hypothetical protein DME55_01895 [Verrucomicrobia bacterium]|nr:MAG: hypothetical protein DME55_01895 [Verrucomicrobiota bacterium]
MWQRCLWLFGFRLALRRLKHPAILRKIGQPAQKNFTGSIRLWGAQAASLFFRQLAEKLFERTTPKHFVTSTDVVGKLPTTAG